MLQWVRKSSGAVKNQKGSALFQIMIYSVIFVMISMYMLQMLDNMNAERNIRSARRTKDIAIRNIEIFFRDVGTIINSRTAENSVLKDCLESMECREDTDYEWIAYPPAPYQSGGVWDPSDDNIVPIAGGDQVVNKVFYSVKGEPCEDTDTASTKCPFQVISTFKPMCNENTDGTPRFYETAGDLSACTGNDIKGLAIKFTFKQSEDIKLKFRIKEDGPDYIYHDRMPGPVF